MVVEEFTDRLLGMHYLGSRRPCSVTGLEMSGRMNGDVRSVIPAKGLVD